MKTIRNEIEDQLRDIIEKSKGINANDRIDILKKVADVCSSLSIR